MTAASYEQIRQQHNFPVTKGFAMAKTHTQLKVLLNIGTDDIKRGFPDAREGDIITLEEGPIRDEMLRKRWAIEYTAEVQNADQKAAEEVREAEVMRAMPAAMAEIAKEEAKEEAVKRAKMVKSGPPVSHDADDEDDGGEASPVAKFTVPVAAEKIAHMRLETVERILATDDRAGVREAAERRKTELTKQA